MSDKYVHQFSPLTSPLNEGHQLFSIEHHRAPLSIVTLFQWSYCNDTSSATIFPEETIDARRKFICSSVFSDFKYIYGKFDVVRRGD